MASALQVSVRRREARGSCSHACSNAAGFAAVRECSPLPESLAFLRIRTLTNSDERAAEVWGVKGSQVQILSSRREVTAGQRSSRKFEAASSLSGE
jgi:hypothetical protein